MAFKCGRAPSGQNGVSLGGIVGNETTVNDEAVGEDAYEAEDLLVEEISIDGLCGVY
jgi:mycofactocin precursor